MRGPWENSCREKITGSLEIFDYYHFIFVFQLLGQAARNMVLQEDAILHSEDVRNNFCYDLSFMCTVCVASGKWNALFLSLFFLMQSLRKMAIITTHLQYQ